MEHQNSKRIILPATGGKDTDTTAAIGILNEGLEKFLDYCNEDDRMFIGGDQKPMGLALRLKRQHPDTYRNIYVTIPDLYFCKSFMHAVLVRCESLGLRDLARLCGFENENQWNYLKCVASTHKTFEFFERLADAPRIALMFEFITCVEENKKITRDQLLTNPSLFSTNLNQFIYKQSNDEIFLKNIEMLETFEIVLSHYTAAQTSNWDLRIGTLKKSLPFAFTFNCTHYAPLLTELFFHQFTFQQRFLYFLKGGYFTYCMRNRDGSAYVGFDVVIKDVNLLAGDFTHKRQNLGQAIQQSNLIYLFLKQQNNIDNNLYFTRSHFEKSFKDDRETKTLSSA